MDEEGLRLNPPTSDTGALSVSGPPLEHFGERNFDVEEGLPSGTVDSHLGVPLPFGKHERDHKLALQTLAQKLILSAPRHLATSRLPIPYKSFGCFRTNLVKIFALGKTYNNLSIESLKWARTVYDRVAMIASVLAPSACFLTSSPSVEGRFVDTITKLGGIAFVQNTGATITGIAIPLLSIATIVVQIAVSQTTWGTVLGSLNILPLMGFVILKLTRADRVDSVHIERYLISGFTCFICMTIGISPMSRGDAGEPSDWGYRTIACLSTTVVVFIFLSQLIVEGYNLASLENPGRDAMTSTFSATAIMVSTVEAAVAMNRTNLDMEWVQDLMTSANTSLTVAASITLLGSLASDITRMQNINGKFTVLELVTLKAFTYNSIKTRDMRLFFLNDDSFILSDSFSMATYADTVFPYMYWNSAAECVLMMLIELDCHTPNPRLATTTKEHYILLEQLFGIWESVTLNKRTFKRGPDGKFYIGSNEIIIPSTQRWEWVYTDVFTLLTSLDEFVKEENFGQWTNGVPQKIKEMLEVTLRVRDIVAIILDASPPTARGLPTEDVESGTQERVASPRARQQQSRDTGSQTQELNTPLLRESVEIEG